MERMEKIALIGAQGYDRKSEYQRVDCFPWDKLNKIINIRDYDIVLLNLLSLERVNNVDWTVFFKLLNPFSMKEILFNEGRIIVIGDPRFSIRIKSATEKEHIERPFLSWTGVKFNWDNEPGESVDFNSDWSHRFYEGYVKHLKQWEYSLRVCELDRDIIVKIFDLDRLRDLGFNPPKLHKDFVCRNRYKGALAFSIRIFLEGQRSHYSGPIVFLPKINLNEDETLMLVLRDFCGVEPKLPEPEWIAEITAPRQKDIDDKMSGIRAQMRSLLEELHLKEAERNKVRVCLKLLYERGECLEETVIEIMRKLGAKVEDPEEPGKEDGWVTVQVDDDIFEGVLEAKSTCNPQFDEAGLRQLLEWINRGTLLREKKYKGIFVGSNSVDKHISERPWAFSDNWIKSAELNQIVAIKTEDLYIIYLLKCLNKLNSEEFWRRLFGTNGVFDSSQYLKMLTDDEKKSLGIS